MTRPGGYDKVVTNLTERAKNLRNKILALAGALLILLGATAAPVALAFESDEAACAMDCCVSEGHCCCNPSKASVKVKIKDGNATVAEDELSRPCPDDCAASQVSVKIQSRSLARHDSHQINPVEKIEYFSQASLVKYDGVILNSAPPRAPPLPLIV